MSVDAVTREDGDVDGLIAALCCHLVDSVGQQITARKLKLRKRPAGSFPQKHSEIVPLI